jgi:hypothetical protein
MKEVYPKIKFKKEDTAAAASDKFLTYSVFAFAKHESGEIRYTFTVECKNNKYRYWFNSFVFVPYEKNRYGVFVPVNGIEIPLEKASSKIDKKELEGYLDQTGLFCKQMGDRLRSYMAFDHTTRKKTDQQPVKKVVTDKW